MKTMKLAKNVLAILAVCFTLTGTTSCNKADKEEIVPQKVIDTNLVGSWEKLATSLSSNEIQNKHEFTFKANGTGVERKFTSNRGVITNDRIETFEWFVKSPGVIHLKNSLNQEADINYTFIANVVSILTLEFPFGEKINFSAKRN